jgi:hypothetical protein
VEKLTEDMTTYFTGIENSQLEAYFSYGKTAEQLGQSWQLDIASDIFSKKIGSGTHSDPKVVQRGGAVSYIDAKNTVPEHHSSLRPSEKELPEWHSSTFLHKNTPGCSI